MTPMTRSQKVTGCCPQRWIVAYMGTFFCAVFYIFRVNISVAIVSMTGPPALNVTDHDVIKINSSLLWASQNISMDVTSGTFEHLSLQHAEDEERVRLILLCMNIYQAVFQRNMFLLHIKGSRPCEISVDVYRHHLKTVR